MIKNKLAFVATTALVGSMMLASSAYAQSTGTTEVDAVVVTAEGQKAIEGVVAETAPKARTTITQEYIDRQGAGQTILQTLNLTPGLNFVHIGSAAFEPEKGVGESSSKPTQTAVARSGP